MGLVGICCKHAGDKFCHNGEHRFLGGVHSVGGKDALPLVNPE